MHFFKNIFNKFILAYRLSQKAYGAYKKHIILLVVLGFLTSFLEAIGINALIPVFSFFFQDGRTGTDFVSKFIEHMFAVVHIDFSLMTMLVFVCVLFIVKSAVLLVANYIKIRIKAGYQKQMMSTLFGNTLRADWTYLLKQKTGYLQTVLVEDIQQSSLLLSNIVRLISGVTGLLIYLVVALNISQAITALAFVFSSVVFVVFKPLWFRARRIARATATMNKEIARHVNEHIFGIKAVKVMGTEREVERIGTRLFETIKALQVRAFLLQEFATAIIQPASVIFICIVIGFSFYRTSYNLGALIAIIYLIQKVFSYLQDIQGAVQLISGRIPFVQDIIHYQEKALTHREHKPKTDINSFMFVDKVSYNNVSFSYDQSRPVLSKINFDVPKGGTLGLVGRSGSGKTTILDLLLRLFDPGQGTITIDGVDISTISIAEWRSRIGYVPQDTFLINDTVRNNIRFYDASITDDDIVESARKAHIYDFIMQLPKQFDTVVGERGSLLSVGQRQRIAIARALARKPEILLLDEATSALDAESEENIRDTIETLKGHTTILMIAHRISTILDCDTVLVLKQGTIVECGDPQKLIDDKNSQFYSTFFLDK